MLQVALVAVVNGTSAPPSHIAGASHLCLNGGGVADFRGHDSTYFNLLCDCDTTLNVRTDLASFRFKDALVHGSFMTEMHFVYHDPSNVVMTVSINSSDHAPFSGVCHEQRGEDEGRKPLHGLHARCGGASVTTRGILVSILTPSWNVVVVRQPVASKIGHGLTTRLYAIRRNHTTTHGLIGYSHRAGELLHGAIDVYPHEGEFTTMAMAEGAIEGHASDYIVDGPHSRQFRYAPACT